MIFKPLGDKRNICQLCPLWDSNLICWHYHTASPAEEDLYNAGDQKNMGYDSDAKKKEKKDRCCLFPSLEKNEPNEPNKQTSCDRY